MTDAKKVSREERRARMPEVSAFVDDLAAEFGTVTVEYAEEGGLVWGKKPREAPAVKVSDMEFWRERQQQRTQPEVRRVGEAKPRTRASKQTAVSRAPESAATRGAIRDLPGVADGSKG